MRVGAALAAGSFLVLAPAALAQVNVNTGALDALSAPSHPHAAPRSSGSHPAPPRASRHAPHPTEPAPTTAKPPGPAQAPPNQPAANQLPKPPIPPIPPAILALPPAVAVPLAHPPPPPVVPVADDAPGKVSPVKGGLRITFGADRSDLNPATVAALRQFADTAKPTQVPINIYAYATGNAEDPSTARRLSLARALAARAVLINEGLPSTRIYPRALGPAGGDADADRVDVVTGPPAPPPSATPSAEPASAGASAQPASDPSQASEP